MNHNNFLKRSMDILLSGLAIIILSPVSVIVSVLIKLSGEDVFFIQERVGQGEKLFGLIKFTTMSKGSEKLGYITTSRDPRPTTLGKFLRKTKINEIPQLINVLVGNMSMVGPRPLVRIHAELYPQDKREKIYSIRSGLTGIGSLYFHHEDSLLASTDNPRQHYADVIMPKKADLELWYAQNWNILLDLRTLFLTFLVLLGVCSVETAMRHIGANEALFSEVTERTQTEEEQAARLAYEEFETAHQEPIKIQSQIVQSENWSRSANSPPASSMTGGR
ncbi:MAG: sugar transferase [Desulfobacteraceae bacterium]|nr:sugar transferase [Desulfobacteraceae bacterium]